MTKKSGSQHTVPAWVPSQEVIEKSNIYRMMSRLNFNDITAFHHWTVTSYHDFWQTIIHELGIVFKIPPHKICDLSAGVESPNWLPGAALNIADSCFRANGSNTALIYQDANHQLQKMSFSELDQLSNRVANSLIKAGFKPSDAIAIIMPMNAEAVAIYLGIIKMGGVVVSIADSFASHEIAARLHISKTKAIFTQDAILRGDKKHPLYEKIKQAQAPYTIVLACSPEPVSNLRSDDIDWEHFLVNETSFTSVSCDPMTACNILFSSGTTAEPKAIVWNHTTAIKAASDAFFHHNIQANDRLAWPTNLGWMMGPWLIFAAMINQASIALYIDLPRDRAFGEFIERAHVTMLGVVPTLVAAWRESHCMEELDWHRIKLFSSTGECSNPEDMRYLMSLAGNKPIIEYCGGTEIGGAYVSSTVIQPNYPSQFSTPTMGMDFVIIDDHGHLANQGEVAIIPPSIGLATKLLNADQYQLYYAGMPTSTEGKVLRRHGDQIQRLDNGYYMILGRVDDTMNLGGIKISAAEIERALTGIDHLTEVAAIAINPPGNGPSLLVIYAATTAALEKEIIKKTMQMKINHTLNPLFKIHDVVLVNDLPKTASNKIMRRILREQYQSAQIK